MTAIEAAALYTGLFLILFFALKLNCGRVRIREKVNFGEGANEKMIQAMRVQANAVEDVPIILIGFYAMAFTGAPALFILVLGGFFLAARLAHALSLGSGDGTGTGRLLGTIGTVLTTLITAGSCLYFALT